MLFVHLAHNRTRTLLTSTQVFPEKRVHGAKQSAHLGPVGLRWAPCWPHESCCTKIHASVIHFLVMRGILPIDHINTSRPRQNQCWGIPAPMTSGVSILDIRFLGVAFRGIPTPMPSGVVFCIFAF